MNNLSKWTKGLFNGVTTIIIRKAKLINIKLVYSFKRDLTKFFLSHGCTIHIRDINDMEFEVMIEGRFVPSNLKEWAPNKSIPIPNEYPLLFISSPSPGVIDWTYLLKWHFNPTPTMEDKEPAKFTFSKVILEADRNDPEEEEEMEDEEEEEIEEKARYKEGKDSYVTHNKHDYSLDKLLKIATKKASKTLPINKLSWILDHTSVRSSRVKRSSLKWPLIAIKQHGRYYVLDGVHRLTKAVQNGKKEIEVKLLTNAELTSCRKGGKLNEELSLWTKELMGLTCRIQLQISTHSPYPINEIVETIYNLVSNKGVSMVIENRKVTITGRQEFEFIDLLLDGVNSIWAFRELFLNRPSNAAVLGTMINVMDNSFNHPGFPESITIYFNKLGPLPTIYTIG